MTHEVPVDTVADPGGDTQERFRYQAACVLRFALSVLLPDDPTECVYAERLEDALVVRGDGKLVPISIKSRRPDQDQYGLGDTSFYKPLARFAIHEKHLGPQVYAYVWAISHAQFRPGLTRFFDGPGLDGLNDGERTELVSRVVNAAGDFNHQITAQNVEAAARKVKYRLLDPLVGYEEILLGRVMDHVATMRALPGEGLRARVRNAIRLVQEMARSEFDFLLPPTPHEVSRTLDQAQAAAKRIDSPKLFELLGANGACAPTREERLVLCLGEMAAYELDEACRAVGAELSPLGLAARLIALDPKAQLNGLLKLRCDRNRRIELAQTARRLSMHSGKAGVQHLRGWREERDPCCLVSRTLDHPWYVADLLRTAEEELRDIWILVPLDRDLLQLDADLVVQAAREEVCRKLGVPEESLEHFLGSMDIRVVLSVSARFDSSGLVARLVAALPSCFVIVETVPDLPDVDACVEYAAPPVETLVASQLVLSVLENIQRNA